MIILFQHTSDAICVPLYSPVLCMSHTLSQSGAHQGLFGATEPQLSTHHGGSLNVPVVVTHCPPLPILQHLHSPLTNHSSAS